MSNSSHIIKDSKEGQIDLLLLWRVFAGHFVQILVVAVLAAGLLGGFRFLTNVPHYTADVKIMVYGVRLTYDSKGEVSGSQVTENASVVGARLAEIAPHIIIEDKSLNDVYDKLQENHGDTYKELNRRKIRSMIAIDVEEQIVTIKVTNADRQIAIDVAEAMIATVPATMDYYFGIPNKDGVETIDSVAKILNEVTEDDLLRTGRGSVLYAMVGFMLGAVVIYAIYFLRSYFDNTVYGEDDLKANFTIPIVGQIPNWSNDSDEASKKKKKKKVDVKESRSDHNSLSDRDYTNRLLNDKTPFAISEAFKSLRTNLCYTTKGEKCAVYGVTSAYVQAGKSLVISNLAASFSMMDKKVLLLDGDLRCPVQHKVFNISNHVHGFSDVLAGISTYEELDLRDGGYKNLHILTCGKLPPNPAELLASENMKRFLERAKQDYDFIFIDLPPVSEVSDAGIISELVTGFVFVVRAGRTDRRMVELAIEDMEAFDAPFAGFILNDIDIKAGGYYKSKYYSGYSKYKRGYGGKYGYKYGYKYARGYGYGAKNGRDDYSTAYSRAAEEAMVEDRASKALADAQKKKKN